MSTAQEFVDKIESEYQENISNGEEWAWKTVYAFSVYPKGSNDPEAENQSGQWVNAQFETADATYIEWYHIIDGKLKAWYQTKGNSHLLNNLFKKPTFIVGFYLIIV